jgi:hypothetical protein
MLSVLGYSDEISLMDGAITIVQKENFSIIQFSEDSNTNTNSSMVPKIKLIKKNSDSSFKCFLLPSESFDKFGILDKFDMLSPYPRRIISVFDTVSFDENRILPLIVLSNAVLSNSFMTNNAFFSPVKYYKYFNTEIIPGTSNTIVTNYKNKDTIESIRTNVFNINIAITNFNHRKIYITVKDFGPSDYKKSSKTKEELKTILENKYTDLVESKNFCYKVFEDSRKLYNERFYELGNFTMQYLMDNIQPGINDTYNKNKDNPFKKNNCYYYLGLNNFKLYNCTANVEAISNALVNFKKAQENDDFDSQMINLKYQQFSDLMVNILTNSFNSSDNTYRETGYEIILFDSEHFDNYEEF